MFILCTLCSHKLYLIIPMIDRLKLIRIHYAMDLLQKIIIIIIGIINNNEIDVLVMSINSIVPKK